MSRLLRTPNPVIDFPREPIRALAQQRWLDELFATLPRADVVDSETGEPPDGSPSEFAVCGGWLLSRRDYPGGKWIRADRFFEVCAGSAGEWTLRKRGAAR